jgi:diaminopimelate decarboxylase
MSRYLSLDLNMLNELIEKYGTPLQIYDGDNIQKNAINFMNIFKEHIKNFKQFFAVKALPNPHILKLLVNCGMGLDCSSLSELKLADLIGVSGKNIMFTSNYTSTEDLYEALKRNVIINLDDINLIDDLYNISKKLPNEIFLRYNPGIGKTDSETNSNILGGPNAKFGMDYETILLAYKKLKDYGVNKIGIHMMTGSNVLDIDYWDQLIDKLFELLSIININSINLGGGIGINYKTGIPINIQELAQKIGSKIKEYNINIENIYMENGRFITGPYGYLLSRCNNVKILYNKRFYGLDACMANLMRPGMYNSYHYITILNKDSNLMLANVVGTLCENNDWFAKDRLLPLAEKNDIFIIWDTGAHSHSMGFQYNGKLRCPEILIYNNKYSLIRRRETFDDYISTVV